VEKQGVIKPGLTPAEEPNETKTAAATKKAATLELDADFRKRAAETATAELQK
jgi:hypothetical protein